MKRLMMAGLLVSGLLFWQAAHATTDMTCSNLDNLIRGRFNCCASTTSSGVCDGLFKAAEEANCGDVCNPCFEFGYAPAPAGCGCTINPDDPDLAQFSGAYVSFACTALDFGDALACCAGFGDPAGSGGGTCEGSGGGGATFSSACF